MNSYLLVAVIFLGAYVFGQIFEKISLPRILGFTIWGIVLAAIWNYKLPPLLRETSFPIKNIALIILCLRAGMGINLKTIGSMGWLPLRLATLPATLEVLSIMLMFHYLLHFSWIISLLAALIMTPMSPAIVITNMLDLQKKGYGKEHKVPSNLVLSCTIEGIIIIAVFSIILDLAAGGTSLSVLDIAIALPRSFLLGLLAGLVAGFLLSKILGYFEKSIRTVERLLILLITSLLLYTLGELLNITWILSIVAMAAVLKSKAPAISQSISAHMDNFWVPCEIILFTLIGIELNMSQLLNQGFLPFLIITLGLLARALGTLGASSRSYLSKKERIFAMVANIPKATIQAALGALPLQLGIEGGDIILTYTIVSILFTTVLGLIGIRKTATLLLEK